MVQIQNYIPLPVIRVLCAHTGTYFRIMPNLCALLSRFCYIHIVIIFVWYDYSCKIASHISIIWLVSIYFDIQYLLVTNNLCRYPLPYISCLNIAQKPAFCAKIIVCAHKSLKILGLALFPTKYPQNDSRPVSVIFRFS